MPEQVWVVAVGAPYAGYKVFGVFSDVDEARSAADRHIKKRLVPEEWVDAWPVEINDKPYFHHHFADDVVTLIEATE